MNIFVLDLDPRQAAQMQVDKHVVKMILETAQLLSTARFLYGASGTYKPTHQGHPCTKWAAESAHNYAWLWHHGMALCEEYTFRYGKRHKSQDLFEGELRHIPAIPRIGRTPFAQAMPDEFKHPDPVIAYRRYYIGAKAHFAKWTNRAEPLWFTLANPEIA